MWVALKRIVTCYIHESLGLKLEWERDLFPSRYACHSGLIIQGASTENWRSGFEYRLRHKFFHSKSSSICLSDIQIFNINTQSYQCDVSVFDVTSSLKILKLIMKSALSLFTVHGTHLRNYKNNIKLVEYSEISPNSTYFVYVRNISIYAEIWCTKILFLYKN